MYTVFFALINSKMLVEFIIWFKYSYLYFFNSSYSLDVEQQNNEERTKTYRCPYEKVSLRLIVHIEVNCAILRQCKKVLF